MMYTLPTEARSMTMSMTKVAFCLKYCWREKRKTWPTPP